MRFLAVGVSDKLGCSPQARGSFRYQRICKTRSGEKVTFALTGLGEVLALDGMGWAGLGWDGLGWDGMGREFDCGFTPALQTVRKKRTPLGKVFVAAKATGLASCHEIQHR